MYHKYRGSGRLLLSADKGELLENILTRVLRMLLLVRTSSKSGARRQLRQLARGGTAVETGDPPGGSRSRGDARNTRHGPVRNTIPRPDEPDGGWGENLPRGRQSPHHLWGGRATGPPAATQLSVASQTLRKNSHLFIRRIRKLARAIL